MNLVGKIFTVLIFVMSLVFMSFSVAVYATHKNWKEVVTNPERTATIAKPLGLTYQLQKTRKRNDELKDQKIKLENELAKQKKAAEQVKSKLETELDTVRRAHILLQERQVALVDDVREAVADMNAVQARLLELRSDISGPDGQSGLRGDIKQARIDRDANFKEARQLEDELHQAIIELKRVRAREFELLGERTKAMDVLRKFGLKPEPTLYTNIPPDVKGRVRAVNESVPGERLVEITIGADDGLLTKHKLHVYRMGENRKYVGDIEVIKTYPDKAVCTIVPKTLQSPMREGDHVASRIR